MSAETPSTHNKRRFRVALSFPGEHRALVEPIAHALAGVYGETQILYDHFHEAEFARPNLAVYLPELYRRDADLIVVLLCPEYAQKRWCRLEWRHIHTLIVTTEEDRIMFLSIGDPGDLSALGILSSDGYIDVGGRTPDEVCGLIRTRARIDTETLASLDPSPTSGGGAARTAAKHELKLSDYLRRLRERTRTVRLPGDKEERVLDSVFVEVEISRADDVRVDSKHDENDEKKAGADEGDPDSRREGTEERLSDDPAESEVRTEVARRSLRPLDSRTHKQTVPSDALVDVAPRVILVGAAGTGKSTLMRRLVWRAANDGDVDPSRRVPLWFPRVPFGDLGTDEDFGDALARQALDAVDLDKEPSEARVALADAIRSGRCVVFVDGLDEAGADGQAALASLLDELEGHVVLASRPRVAAKFWHNVTQVTLHGIPAIDAEGMLTNYFPGQPWVSKLITWLRGLPDGRVWLETPMLLGLAAMLSREGIHPTSTIELYKQAASFLLKRMRNGEKHRGPLSEFARARLLPESGPPRVSFHVGELPAPSQHEWLRTGLFEGTVRLRFAHLSLGEILAAESVTDLGAARARLVEDDVHARATADLEVLPMAHALRAPTALEGALAEVREKDRGDHRVLRLLLRAIGYGGDGVALFCGHSGAEIVKLVAERLQAPGGRFDEPERDLMDAAERAFMVMRGVVAVEFVKEAFAPLLRTRGEAAAEAHAATWILGAWPPSYAQARYWRTIHRQGRAIVRETPEVDAVRRLTQGSDELYRLEIVLEALGTRPEHWRRLRPFLNHPSERLRRSAVRLLLAAPDAQDDLAERFTDDEPVIRGWIVHHFAADLGRRATFMPRLRHALTADSSMHVRAQALKALKAEPETLEWARRALAETLSVPKTFSWDFVSLRQEAIRVLAADPGSSETIRGLLAGPKGRWTWDEKLLRDLKRVPAWRDLLLWRLDAEDVAPVEVRAMADDPYASGAITRLLDRDDEDVVVAAIESLRDIDAAVRHRLVALVVDDSPQVRQEAIHRLGKSREHWPLLRRLLVMGDKGERAAAVVALGDDPDSRDVIFRLLHEGPSTLIMQEAITALSRDILGRAAVREYFRLTRSKPELETHGPDTETIAHDFVRAHALRTLARGAQELDVELVQEALADPHPGVRAAAIALATPAARRERKTALLGDPHPSVQREVFKTFVADPDVERGLLVLLREDDWALRMVALGYLVDHVAARARMVELLGSTNIPAHERGTLLAPLSRDRDARKLLRGCIFDGERVIRATALDLLKHDQETRDAIRDKIRDREWLRQQNLELDIYFDVLRNDVEAHEILRGHLEAAVAEDDDLLGAMLVRALENDEVARLRLRELLNHESINMRVAAIGALKRDGASRGRLLVMLSASDTPTREAAADALRGVPQALPAYIQLLSDPEKKIRRIALEALRSSREPETRRAILARLSIETDDETRHEVLNAIADEPEGINALRERLLCDTNALVRKAAARALGGRAAEPAYALERMPAIQRLLSGMAGAAPEDKALARLNALLRDPEAIDLDSDPELAKVALAWLCARLTWASEDGSMSTGRMYGENERPIALVPMAGQTIVIRVSMDVSDLLRERLLRPTQNLVAAWEVARRWRSSDPPTILLACADVGFEHLSPPVVEPGQTLWGPTWFGCRLSGPEPPPANGPPSSLGHKTPDWAPGTCLDVDAE